MQAFVDSVQANAGLIGLIGLLVALIALIVALRGLRRPSHGHSSAPGPALVDDPALDQILSTQMQRLDGLSRDVRGLAARTTSVEAQGRLAVQSAGLVRFNPFREDTGGNLSFALALLDAEDNGFVLSSLHSRQTTRVYIKSISAGQPDQTLSAEETQALQQARSGGPGTA